jgi:hypothetical protein
MYKLKAILYQFNRPVFVFNLVLSLYLIYEHNAVNYSQGVFIKFCSYSFVIGYQYFTASKTYFYFRNAGYTIRRLYIYSMIADIVIFSILYFIPQIIYELIHA